MTSPAAAVSARNGDNADAVAIPEVGVFRNLRRVRLPKTETAAPAVAGSYMDVHLIDEHPDQYTGSGLPDRNDGDAAAMVAMILEPDFAIEFGKQRVVLAESNVQAWLEAASLLAHQDRAARDEIAVVALDAQALCVAVPAVS